MTLSATTVSDTEDNTDQSAGETKIVIGNSRQKVGHGKESLLQALFLHLGIVTRVQFTKTLCIYLEATGIKKIIVIF